MPESPLSNAIHDRIAGDTETTSPFALDVHRLLAPDGDHEYTEPVIGVAVSLPNGAVYADWNLEAWPENQQLDEPHVSRYGSLNDLCQVTDCDVEHIDSIDAYDP